MKCTRELVYGIGQSLDAVDGDSSMKASGKGQRELVYVAMGLVQPVHSGALAERYGLTDECVACLDKLVTHLNPLKCGDMF